MTDETVRLLYYATPPDSTPCLQRAPPRLYLRRPTKRPALPQAGSPRPAQNSRRQATCFNRPPMRSSSRNCSRRQAMHFPGRLNAERNARNRTKLPMRGGMRPKPTNEAILIVSVSSVLHANCSECRSGHPGADTDYYPPHSKRPIPTSS
jgi:hypothetical protein